MLENIAARKVSPGSQRRIYVTNQERRMMCFADRTDTTSLRFVRVTGKFVAKFERIVNDTKEFTIEERDFQYIY